MRWLGNLVKDAPWCLRLEEDQAGMVICWLGTMGPTQDPQEGFHLPATLGVDGNPLKVAEGRCWRRGILEVSAATVAIMTAVD